MEGQTHTAEASGQFRKAVLKNGLHRIGRFLKGALADRIKHLFQNAQRMIASHLTFGFIHALALQLVLFPVLAEARPAPRAQEKQPLGSLSSIGPAYVGDSVVPASATIFTGDTLRLGDAATATFTMSGRGSLEIASRTQLVFTGSQQYVAELKAGTVVMSSSSGPSGINLRIGSYVVLAVTQGEQSTAKIDGAADGSFVISCAQGSVGIVPIEGSSNGVFLQVGQSISLSPQGELSAPRATVASTTTPSPAQPSATAPKSSSHTGLIVLGVAGAAGAIGAAVALGGKKSGQTVSQSAP
jgi:hypothetical protein